MPSCRTMSSRTSAVAVAVSASMGGRPSALHHRAERQVVGAKIVSPLAHAVRFVDDEQADLAREQPVEEVAVLEALGREVEDLALAVQDLPRGFTRLRRVEMRVHGERVDAVRGELVLLVLHERDERAHDDRQARQHQRGKLVNERLAAAGRHDDERVRSTEHGADRLPLSRLKVRVTEPFCHDGARLSLGACRLHAPGEGRKRAYEGRQSERCV